MGPFIKSEKNTNDIMYHLLIALAPIVLFAYIKNGIIPFVKGYANVLEMFYPLAFLAVSVLSTVTFETLYKMLFEKKQFKDAIKNTYSIFPGLFLGLILPINTPILLVILGAFVSSIVAKMLFGGFGNNIFNPALVGRLFIISAYALVISKNGGYLNSYEIDAISSGTPLTNASLINGIGTYETLVRPYGRLLNFFIGTIPGSLGETSSLLCLVGLFYLIRHKAIKWKIPVTYILTVFGMTYVIGGMNNLGIWYPLFQIFSGGLMFGAVFMATDPVTSPVTPIGQILYGLFLGILTVTFRFLTPFPEGVLTSILTMNMLVVILDRIGAVSRFNFKKTIIPFVIAWILILGLSIGISINLKSDKKTKNFDIIEKTKNGKETTYVVSKKGYSGTIKAEIIIEDKKVKEINILEQNDSFYQKVEDSDFIEKLKENPDTDTVTGATITSTTIKEMVKGVLEDYGE